MILKVKGGTLEFKDDYFVLQDKLFLYSDILYVEIVVMIYDKNEEYDLVKIKFKNKFFKCYISIYSSDSGLAESFFRKKNIMVKRKYHDNRFDNNN